MRELVRRRSVTAQGKQLSDLFACKRNLLFTQHTNGEAHSSFDIGQGIERLSGWHQHSKRRRLLKGAQDRFAHVIFEMVHIVEYYDERRGDGSECICLERVVCCRNAARVESL